jgi:chaperonin GroEL
LENHLSTNSNKDGVTVAKEIELRPIRKHGSSNGKRSSLKTNDWMNYNCKPEAQAIVKEGLKNVAAGANPMDLKRGIDKQ